jgi:tryptophan 7-halogenase
MSAVTHIVICGGGLAAHMTAAALTRQLPATIHVTLVGEDVPVADVFHGSVAPPSAYAFNLAAGVPEPRLLLDGDTAFSWGTRFLDWGGARRAWTQCFHLPFPIIQGAPFHHYLSRLGIRELEPLLVPAVLAQRGVFAHPLDRGSGLLARAEYGYQFDARNYQRAFLRAASGPTFRLIRAQIAEVARAGNGIAALSLSNGETLAADLFIDCTGIDAELISVLDGEYRQGRRLRALASGESGAGVGAPCRMLTAHDFGWQSETALQGGSTRLTVFHPDAESERSALATHGRSPQHSIEVVLGHRSQAWVQNCVALGHAAGIVEPLTPAPMLLLQRDIDRLVSLIPVTMDMSVERREFNRQSAEDHEHAEIFNRALLDTPPAAETPYWRAAREQAPHDKLLQKLTQFASRGVLVPFDHEPFNAEDWTILHFGMGRMPARYDRIADRATEADIRRFVENLRREIDSIAKSLPSHDDYLKGLIRYLRDSNW